MFLYLFVDMGHVLRCRDLPNLVCAKTFPLLFCSMVTKNLPNEWILLYVSKKSFLTLTEFECGIGLYRPLQTNSFWQNQLSCQGLYSVVESNVFYFQFYAILGVISLYQEFSLDEQVTSAFELRPVSTKIRFVIDMLEMNESHIWYRHVSRLPRGLDLQKI